jgi:hypothetical protein
MNCAFIRLRSLLAIAALAFAACSNLPDDPGLYAVMESGDTQRLSGGPKWDRKTWADRSDLPPKLRFFIVEPAIAENPESLDETITLRRAGWVRSDIKADGGIAPATGVQWVAANIDSLTIPLAYQRVGKRNDIIAAIPKASALDGGLYVLDLNGGGIRTSGRFGVNWTHADKNAYASKTCIDRYVRQEGAEYRRCLEQQQTTATIGLQLIMVEPERRLVDGRPAIVVKGVVLNRSDRRRSIPSLEGRLIDAAGQTLHDWRFRAVTGEVEPGRSVSFGAIVKDAPDNVKNIQVRFAGSDNSG